MMNPNRLTPDDLRLAQMRFRWADQARRLTKPKPRSSPPVGMVGSADAVAYLRRHFQREFGMTVFREFAMLVDRRMGPDEEFRVYYDRESLCQEERRIADQDATDLEAIQRPNAADVAISEPQGGAT